MQLISDVKANNYDTGELEKRLENSLNSRRFFTVQSVTNIEVLALTFDDIELIKNDFKMSWRPIIKSQIE